MIKLICISNIFYVIRCPRLLNTRTQHTNDALFVFKTNTETDRRAEDMLNYKHNGNRTSNKASIIF